MAPIAIFEDSSLPVQDAKLLAGTCCLSANTSPPQSFINQEGSWDAIKSASLYEIEGWGAPYFCINPNGDMAVRPHGPDTELDEEVTLIKVINQILKPKINGGLGLNTPAILRFPDVLKDRLHTLQSCFDNAIISTKYRSCFQGVFPVKCNQDCSVIDNIVEFGRPFAFGLEAGSKPELLLAMTSLCKGSPQALLVCNGYKDADYICLALLARLIGLNCVVVLEQEEELELVLSISKELCIEPVIGLRAKLNTKHAGHFGDTSGERGKFGLSCSEIVGIMRKLHRQKQLSSLQFLHFHIGSQIPSLAVLKDGVSEAAQMYCELALMGANMKFIDIGGGLGIDYDGTKSSNSDMSVGYTMEEYALQVVQAISDACDMKAVKHPILCSESGRALVSHHSVLVFDVLSSSSVNNAHNNIPQGVSLEIDGLPATLKNLHNSLSGCARACDYEGALECARLLKRDCIELFKHGQLGLAQLAHVNSIYDVICASVEESWQESMSSMGRTSDTDELDEDGMCIDQRTEGHNAVYQINLSVFRAMPDTWAIGQLFPIVPLQRLDEEPKVRATLSDLTCDSDGKIATFVGKDSKGRRQKYVRVHALEEGKAYHMGMFLGGAYQEALGNLHNLFGSPNVVSVCKGGGGGKAFKVTKVSDEQTAADVLRLVHHDPSSMLDILKLQIQKSLNYEHEELAMGMVHTIAYSFGSSTYLSSNNLHSSILSQRLLCTKPSSSMKPPSLEPLVSSA